MDDILTKDAPGEWKLVNASSPWGIFPHGKLCQGLDTVFVVGTGQSGT